MKNINTKIIWKKIKHFCANIGSDSDKDWRIILSLFLIGVVFSIGWHLNILFTLDSSIKNVSNSIVVKNGEVNVTTLEETIHEYDTRNAEYQKLADTEKQLVDPAR